MVNRYTIVFNTFNDTVDNMYSETHYNKQAQFSFDVSDDATYDVPVREFCNFLSSIYGYDIASKILEE